MTLPVPMSVPVRSAAPAGISLFNNNRTACAVRVDDIADHGTRCLENLDAGLLKTHQWPPPNPSNHDYVSPGIA